MLVADHLLTEQPREQPHKKLGGQPGTRKKNMSVQEKLLCIQPKVVVVQDLIWEPLLIPR